MIAVNARLFALITLLSITLFKYKTNSRTTGRSLSKFLSDTPSMLRIRYRDAFLKIRRSNAIWGNGLLSSFSKAPNTPSREFRSASFCDFLKHFLIGLFIKNIFWVLVRL